MRVIAVNKNVITFDNGDIIVMSQDVNLQLFDISLLGYEFTSRPMFGIVPKMVIVMYHKDRFWMVPYKNQNIRVYYNSDMVRVKNMKTVKTLIKSFDRSELVDKATLDCLKEVQSRMKYLKNKVLPESNNEYIEASKVYRRAKNSLNGYIREYKACKEKINQIKNEITNARYARALQVLNDTRIIVPSEYYNDIRPEPKIQHGLIENKHKFTEWIDKIIKDVAQGTSKPSDELSALIFDTLVQLGHEQSSMQTSLLEEIDWNI